MPSLKGRGRIFLHQTYTIIVKPAQRSFTTTAHPHPYKAIKNRSLYDFGLFVIYHSGNAKVSVSVGFVSASVVSVSTVSVGSVSVVSGSVSTGSVDSGSAGSGAL